MTGDGIYCDHFPRRADGIDIREVSIAPRSPSQNPYVERLIGSIRYECVVHIILLNKQLLRRIIASYLRCYYLAA